MGEARPSLGNTQMIVMILEREWSNGIGRKKKKKKEGGGGEFAINLVAANPI